MNTAEAYEYSMENILQNISQNNIYGQSKGVFETSPNSPDFHIALLLFQPLATENGLGLGQNTTGVQRGLAGHIHANIA